MAKKKSEGGGGVPLPSKKTQEKSTRLIVSILYIILGISTILNVFDAFVNLFKGQTDGMTATILTFTVGILMALAGCRAESPKKRIRRETLQKVPK